MKKILKGIIRRIYIFVEERSYLKKAFIIFLSYSPYIKGKLANIVSGGGGSYKPLVRRALPRTYSIGKLSTPAIRVYQDIKKEIHNSNPYSG